ncbi:hypothetical protein [Cellulomonas endophytica]|uniref:hypothetical protein n=1 Tax=Cellulomonas endophytica TaxID=2494735 RepID=UPI0013E9008F|nr:hypothetical protein [Cellulomonas endophytica]
MTPHHFRKTVATMIEREVGAAAAAAQLGHSSPAVTRTHYIQRNTVAPDHAALLESKVPRPQLD